MRLAVALAVLLVAGYALVHFGLQSIDRAQQAELDAHRRARQNALAGARDQWEAAIGDAHERAGMLLSGTDLDNTELLFHVRAGSIRYAPPDSPLLGDDQELRLYDAARIGGESFEFERQDPARAVDAYSFYLDRIATRDLLDRLRFRIARAAAAGGSTALAESVQSELLAASQVVRERGLPLNLLAGIALLESDASRVDAFCDAIQRWWRELETPVLRDALRRAGRVPPALKVGLQLRSVMETELRPRLVELQPRHPLLTPSALHVMTGDGSARVARVPLPDIAASRLTTNEPQDTASLPIRVWPLATTIGWVVESDSDEPAVFDQIATRFRRQRLLLIVAVIVLCGAGGSFLWSLERQRRLAELKVKLLANVSHELKTPVTAIRLFSEMLASDDLEDAQVRRFGHLLTAESRRLTQRIDDLLDYAQRGDRPLDDGCFDLKNVVGPLGESYTYRCHEEGVRLIVTLPDGPAWVQGDDNAVERIVLNLLDNAIKYRCKQDPEVEITVLASAIEVRDNGIGIPKREQARIFEEFHRVGFEHYRIQGAGLGLAIARSLAERMGGSLTVSSDTGAGSCFRLQLQKGSSHVR